jgi:hypothetical protein
MEFLPLGPWCLCIPSTIQVFLLYEILRQISFCCKKNRIGFMVPCMSAWWCVFSSVGRGHYKCLNGTGRRSLLPCFFSESNLHCKVFHNHSYIVLFTMRKSVEQHVEEIKKELIAECEKQGVSSDVVIERILSTRDRGVWTIEKRWGLAMGFIAQVCVGLYPLATQYMYMHSLLCGPDIVVSLRSRKRVVRTSKRSSRSRRSRRSKRSRRSTMRMMRLRCAP